jgi:hypothetical protein
VYIQQHVLGHYFELKGFTAFIFVNKVSAGYKAKSLKSGEELGYQHSLLTSVTAIITLQDSILWKDFIPFTPQL